MRASIDPYISSACLRQRKKVDNVQFFDGFLPSLQHISLCLFKLIMYLFPIYFILLLVIRMVLIIRRMTIPRLGYPIEAEIVSTTTRVIFTRSKRTNEQICLKMWQWCDKKVSKIVNRCPDYLLEGLAFNRQFAPGVYLGIAPVRLSDKPKRIRRGWLIEKPKKLKSEVEYALVMRCLPREWQLEYQLSQEAINKRKVIEFLAEEVAVMHSRLANSPDDKGTPACISSKLEINRNLFNEALDELACGNIDVGKYRQINSILIQACKSFTELFQQRYDSQRIKRCHGDLKATNLWICPENSLFFGSVRYPQQLLALDCVDFNPDFCHIDTLSDVAMLAIDIETRLTDFWHKNTNRQYGQKIARHFLRSYLREAEENTEGTRPLLEYYLAEKAMVCAYVSILYDNQQELGEKYLDVALVHAQRLARMLTSQDNGRTSEKSNLRLIVHSI